MGLADPDYGTDRYVDIDISMHPSWNIFLQQEFDKPYMQRLYTHIQQQVLSGEAVPNLFTEFREKHYYKVTGVKVFYGPSYVTTNHEKVLLLVGTIFGKRNKDWDRFISVVEDLIEEKNGNIRTES